MSHSHRSSGRRHHGPRSSGRRSSGRHSTGRRTSGNFSRRIRRGNVTVEVNVRVRQR